MDGVLPASILYKQKYAVRSPRVPINLAGRDRIAVGHTDVFREMNRTIVGSTQPSPLHLWPCPTVAAEIPRIEIAKSRATRPWRVVVQIKHLLVERVGCGRGCQC